MRIGIVSRSILVLLFLCLGVLAFSANASEKSLDVTEVGPVAQSLTQHIVILEDPGATLTLADVMKPDMASQFSSGQASAAAVNLGFTRSVYWLRLALRNAGDKASEHLLEVENPRLSRIDFYQPDVHGVYRSVETGGDLPFASRAYSNRNFVFPVSLPAHAEQLVYLRVQSTIAIIVPARLWTVPAFHANERNDYMVQAWYFGMAAAMALFNLMLFIALKDRIYFQYVLFVVLAVLTIAAKSGMASEFVWPGVILWSNVSYYLCASLALAALLMFTRGMLDTAQLTPRVDRLLGWLIGIYLLSPLAYFVALQTVARTAVLLFMVTAFLILITGVICAFKRQRSAYFFVGAFGLLMVGGAMTTMRSVGLLPTNAFTVDGLQLGSALEMLLLAFALADRYNVMRREKVETQQALLQSQQLLLDTLKSSERVLEQRVAERTHELQTVNAQLETLSLVDGLTGIANRRHFDAVLAKEWERARRLGQPLALVLMDVDWFKQYNDHYGHQAGDQCLREIARVFADTVSRTSDLVARYGGEEFVCIAPPSSTATDVSP
jgi:hypothetical protein